MTIKKWIPNIVTLVLTALLIITQQVWADPVRDLLPSAIMATSKTAINYQGYLTDSSGNPVNATLPMTFRLYSAASGGTALWTETQSAVVVNDGLFSVLLGSVTPIPIIVLANNNDLWLGIAVGADSEMSPRDKIASAPYALLANVADGSITQFKLADDAVTSAKIANGTVGSDDVGFNYAGSSSKGGAATDLVCTNCIQSTDIQDGEVTSADIENNTITESDIIDTFIARDADKLDGNDSTYFAVASHNHDSLYYTETESDNRFVNTSGDSMSGNLTLGAGLYMNGNNVYMGGTTNEHVVLRQDGDQTNLFIVPWGGSGRLYDNVVIGSSSSYRTNLSVYGNVGANGLSVPIVKSPVNTDLTIDAGDGSINTLYLNDAVVINDIFAPGGRNLVVGDDGYFSDIDTANTIGVYGTQSGSWGYLKTYITSPSSRDYKTDISALSDEQYDSILQQIREMDVTYYHLLDVDDEDSPLRLGIIAEDAPAPIVSPDGKGIDLYELSAFILAGLKSISSDIPPTIEGLARLNNGMARVTLEQAFLDTVDGDFIVHLTPYGDASLYVAEIGKDYFVVKARDGKQNIAFAWRLSAHRKGYSGVQLESVDMIVP